MEDDARTSFARPRRGARARCRRPSGWRRSSTSPTSARRSATRTAAEACSTPELARYAGGNVMVGHLVGVLRAADRYLGDDRVGARGVGPGGGALRVSARRSNTRLGARTWLAHTAYWYARMLLARGRRRRRRTPRRSSRIALGLDADDRAARPRARRATASSARTSSHDRRAATDGLSAREVEILVELARGPLEPRDRPDPPHQRAHGREPHPLDPPQDELRESHRGRRLRASARARAGLIPVREQESAEADSRRSDPPPAAGADP